MLTKTFKDSIPQCQCDIITEFQLFHNLVAILHEFDSKEFSKSEIKLMFTLNTLTTCKVKVEVYKLKVEH